MKIFFVFLGIAVMFFLLKDSSFSKKKKSEKKEREKKKKKKKRRTCRSYLRERERERERRCAALKWRGRRVRSPALPKRSTTICLLLLRALLLLLLEEFPRKRERKRERERENDEKRHEDDGGDDVVVNGDNSSPRPFRSHLRALNDFGAGLIGRRKCMRQVSSSVSLLSRLERVRSLEGHRGCVNCCSFTQDGNTLITGSDDTSIKLWNWRSGVLDSTLPTLHSGNVFQARQLLHGMSDWIVSCAADGQVQLHSMEGGGEASLVLGFHTGRAHKISLNPVDANTFLSCGEDGLVLSYDTRSKSSRQVVAFFSERGRRVPLNSVVHNPLDPNKFALAGGDNFVRIYDARMLPNPIEKLTPFTDETKRIGLHITCLEYSSVGELLATYSEDFIYLWSNRHDQEVDRPKKFSGHLNCETVKGVSFFGPNDDFVLSGSDDGHVFIWSKDTCKLLQLLKADKDIVNCLTPHPDLTTLTLATSGTMMMIMMMIMMMLVGFIQFFF